MAASDVHLERLREVPFKPFYIPLRDGGLVYVQSPDAVTISATGDVWTVVLPGGGEHRIETKDRGVTVSSRDAE